MKKSGKVFVIATLVIALSSLGLASNTFDHIIFIDAGTPNLTVNMSAKSVFASANSSEANASDQAFKAELETLGIAVD